MCGPNQRPTPKLLTQLAWPLAAAEIAQGWLQCGSHSVSRFISNSDARSHRAASIFEFGRRGPCFRLPVHHGRPHSRLAVGRNESGSDGRRFWVSRACCGGTQVAMLFPTPDGRPAACCTVDGCLTPHRTWNPILAATLEVSLPPSSYPSPAAR
eukprot:364599-Chlamydomonas_euryale.AAC.7